MATDNPFSGDEKTPVAVMHPHPNAPKRVAMSFLDKAYAFTAPFEGIINHMYLDSKGFVTVGVGCLLSSPREAIKLPFIPSTEVTADFIALQNKPAGHVASWYKQFTHCLLPSAAIRSEFDRRGVSFVDSLRRLVPTFDDAPEPAQLAMFDIIWNVGSGSMATSWVNLKEAFGRRDFITCASESRRRPPVSAERNVAVGKLFIAAHQQDHSDA
jgi:GH24 family phage-related lysozyme (muramidase)